jgi:hypothetical protein
MMARRSLTRTQRRREKTSSLPWTQSLVQSSGVIVTLTWTTGSRRMGMGAVEEGGRLRTDVRAELEVLA